MEEAERNDTKEWWESENRWGIGRKIKPTLLNQTGPYPRRGEIIPLSFSCLSVSQSLVPSANHRARLPRDTGAVATRILLSLWGHADETDFDLVHQMSEFKKNLPVNIRGHKHMQTCRLLYLLQHSSYNTQMVVSTYHSANYEKNDCHLILTMISHGRGGGVCLMPSVAWLVWNGGLPQFDVLYMKLRNAVCDCIFRN